MDKNSNTKNQFDLFSTALIRNQVLKAKILSILFLIIASIQIVTLIYFKLIDHEFLKEIPGKVLVFGPLSIFFGFILEFFYYRKLKNHLDTGTLPNQKLNYIVALFEFVFPGAIIVFWSGFFIKIPQFSAVEIINSPPIILYFIFIILSALSLNERLSVFGGFVSGIQYFFICLYINHEYGNNSIFIPNAIAKSLLLIVSGLITGFVTSKIRLAIHESIESKNKLIFELDSMVEQKTREVVQQKEEIELQHAELMSKNKDILDSIKYARRIQTALITNDVYIAKSLKRLKN